METHYGNAETGEGVWDVDAWIPETGRFNITERLGLRLEKFIWVGENESGHRTVCNLGFLEVFGFLVTPANPEPEMGSNLGWGVVWWEWHGWTPHL